MTRSRQSQVSLSDTPYYHCISRCVCRAYLCSMAYVDLNPISAKIAASVERAEFTSTYECIHGVAQQQEKPLECAFTKKLLFGS